MNQADLEQDMVRRGVDRYWDMQRRSEERGHGYINPASSNVIFDIYHGVEGRVRAAQQAALSRLEGHISSGYRISGWEPYLVESTAQTVAYIAIRSCLHSNRRIQSVIYEAGAMLQLDVRWREARKGEAARARLEHTSNRIEMLKRTVKEVNAKIIRKWLKRLDRLDLKEPLEYQKTIQLGAVMVDCVLQAVPHLVSKKTHIKYVNGHPRTHVEIEHSQELLNELRDNHDAAALRHPWLLPMISPPISWTNRHTRAGYHTEPLAQPLVKPDWRNSHQMIPSEDTIRALNMVQSTPWSINTRVLDVARVAIDGDIGPLPYDKQRTLPDSIPDDIWDQMTRAERGEVKSRREEIHAHNNKAKAKAALAQRTLSVAKEFSQYPLIWFPWNLDWRGRMYPLAQDLNPQSDDLSRSLLVFGKAKPLGASGLLALEHHLAGCYGLDKVSRLEQQQWCQDNWDRLVVLAVDPFNPVILDWWSLADKPWSFLAAAIEYVCADHDPEYRSNLPCHVDGSCNGLQHLSAMSRDMDGGIATNLVPGERRDIYQMIADRVEKLSTGTVWEGRIDRKVVKRAVMTTPYGVTSRGIRDQLIQDGWLDGVPGDRLKNADLLRDIIEQSIGQSLESSMSAMSWFRKIGGSMALQYEVPVRWETPCGNVISQNYVRYKQRRAATVLGMFTVLDKTTKSPKIHKTKQAIAPNIIHSYDASHLVMTVLDMEGLDISWSLIHDSYGVHACDLEQLGKSLRKTFVEIYKENQFYAILASVFINNPEFHLDSAPDGFEPPQMGTLDIKKVLDSECFFY